MFLNGEEIAKILMVTSLNDNGRYKIGDEISVSVMYSKNVMVTGSPNIALNTNNPPSDGIYQSGSGSKELVFNYIVKEGDNTLDLEYVSSTSIALNEGSFLQWTIKLLTIYFRHQALKALLVRIKILFWMEVPYNNLHYPSRWKYLAVRNISCN